MGDVSKAGSVEMLHQVHPALPCTALPEIKLRIGHRIVELAWGTAVPTQGSIHQALSSRQGLNCMDPAEWGMLGTSLMACTCMV